LDIFSGKNSPIGGFLQFKANLLNISSSCPPRKMIEKPQLKKYQLRAHIYQGRDLPSGDSDGASDPVSNKNI